MHREQEAWPDGSVGVKTASFCITCGLLEIRPGRTCFNEGKEAEFADVEILPASASLPLVEALEIVIETLERCRRDDTLTYEEKKASEEYGRRILADFKALAGEGK